MPFILIGIGILFIVIAVQNTQDKFFTLIKGDFTGKNNFVYWIVSILIIGSIGYIPKLKAFSDSFLFLVLLVLFIAKGNPKGQGGGFFTQFNNQINGNSSSTTVTPLAPLPNISVSPGYNMGVVGNG